MYVVSRFIIGFGLPYAIVAGSSLVGELAYPKERAILTSLFNAAYFIGSITAAGITFGTQLIPSDWYVDISYLSSFRFRFLPQPPLSSPETYLQRIMANA
jgi:MFS family permease